MRLIEIFDSIQGEGPAMGMPATFVRFAGCNLRCQGCDTDQKAHWQMSLPDVLARIRGDRVIITGGEPTMQMREFSELISLLHSHDKEIHIESNGTNPIAEEILKKIRYAVISPKRGSDFHLNFWAIKENVHLKFVMGKAPWCWTSSLLEPYLPTLDRSRVWIMAYGTDQEMMGARVVWDLAMKLGINYSDRLHIRLLKR